MARLRFLDLPRPVNEATKFQVTTKRGEEAPRLATRILRKEQSKVKNYRMLFSEFLKRRSKTKKFLSIFWRLPPTPPAAEKKKGKENFWVLPARPQGADEARRIRAYDLVSLHHARGACDIICFGNRCEFGTIKTPQQK